MENQTEYFYQKKWFMWIMIIFLFPVGLFLLWKYNHYSKTIKIVLSVIVVGIIIASGKNNAPVTPATSKPIKVEMTLEQKQQEFKKWSEDLNNLMNKIDNNWKGFQNSTEANKYNKFVLYDDLKKLANQADSIQLTAITLPAWVDKSYQKEIQEAKRDLSMGLYLRQKGFEKAADALDDNKAATMSAAKENFSQSNAHIQSAIVKIAVTKVAIEKEYNIELK